MECKIDKKSEFKKVESVNKDINYHRIILEDIGVKDDFTKLEFNIVNDISLTIEIKFENKFTEGKGFGEKLKFFKAIKNKIPDRSYTQGEILVCDREEDDKKNDKNKNGKKDSNRKNEVNIEKKNQEVKEKEKKEDKKEENKKEDKKEKEDNKVDNKNEDKKNGQKESNNLDNKSEEIKEKEDIKEKNKNEDKITEQKEDNKVDNKNVEKEKLKEEKVGEEEKNKDEENEKKEKDNEEEKNKDEKIKEVNNKEKEEERENEKKKINNNKNEDKQLQKETSKNKEANNDNSCSNNNKEEINSNRKDNGQETESKNENLSTENELKYPKQNIEELLSEINKLKKMNEEKDSKLEDLRKQLEEKDNELSSKEIKNIQLEDKISYFSNLKQKLKKEEENRIKNHENTNKIYFKTNNSILFKEAILRCLSQTEKLSEFFRNDDNKDKIINNNIALKNKNDYQLSPAYYDFINTIQKNNNKINIPEALINIIGKIDSSYARGKASNSKMFLIFILKQLHNELKESKNINNYNDKKNKNLDIYDKLSALNYSIEEFQKGYSVIKEIFYGFRENSFECLNCNNYNNNNSLYYDNNFNFDKKNISYNYGTFNCLLFSLEKIKNFYQKNEISIYDCFRYNEEAIKFNGVNKYFCNICNDSCECLYTSKIYFSPLVFIMIFDRKKNNLFDVKLNFNEEIEATQYILNKDNFIIYQLYAMITYTFSDNDIKYFAICKNLNDGKWYRYYEDKVYSISDIKKDIDKNEIPYILFFQKFKDN